jgi:hypothetical protein
MAKRKKAAPVPVLYPREVLEDKAVKAEDGHRITRGWVVRDPAHYSPSLLTTVPVRRGRVRDVFRVPTGSKPEQVVVEVALDGGGRGYLDAARVRRSYAEIEE